MKSRARFLSLSLCPTMVASLVRIVFSRMEMVGFSAGSAKNTTRDKRLDSIWSRGWHRLLSVTAWRARGGVGSSRVQEFPCDVIGLHNIHQVSKSAQTLTDIGDIGFDAEAAGLRRALRRRRRHRHLRPR